MYNLQNQQAVDAKQMIAPAAPMILPANVIALARKMKTENASALAVMVKNANVIVKINPFKK